MTATTDFLPFATGGGANVESQTTFAADPTTAAGFSAGIAPSAKLNKVWRQSSFIASAVATFTINQTGVSAPDDGNLAAFVTNFTNAVGAVATAAAGQGPNSLAYQLGQII